MRVCVCACVCVCVHICVCVSSMTRGTWVQIEIESYQRLKKWYFISPCLTLSIIRYGSRVKWGNPGKAVAPSLTPWCGRYREGSLLVTSTTVANLLMYVYRSVCIYIHVCMYVCIITNLSVPAGWDTRSILSGV